jgi:hypothetical protein
MWRPPSGKQKAGGAKLPAGGASRGEFPCHNLPIVADNTPQVKLADPLLPNADSSGKGIGCPT